MRIGYLPIGRLNFPPKFPLAAANVTRSMTRSQRVIRWNTNTRRFVIDHARLSCARAGPREIPTRGEDNERRDPQRVDRHESDRAGSTRGRPCQRYDIGPMLICEIQAMPPRSLPILDVPGCSLSGRGEESTPWWIGHIVPLCSSKEGQPCPFVARILTLLSSRIKCTALARPRKLDPDFGSAILPLRWHVMPL